MKNWIKILLLLPLAACGPEKTRPETRAALYHWRTQCNLNPSDSLKLDSLGIHRLYVRFFDIDQFGSQLKPVGVVEFKQPPPAHLEVVPCVFLTNRAMRFVPDTALESLALHIHTKLTRISGYIPNHIPEVQIDCDWTEETRDRYFRLLSILKTLYEKDGILLSATIRLHQVKYPDQTGIPPVDRGMLMFYNMGNLDQPGEQNSILNLETAGLYTGSLPDYPLELDLALPLFSWVVQFRSGEFFELRSSWTREDMEGDTLLLQESANWFVAKENGLFKGEYLVKGDRFRVEEGTPELDIESIQKLSLLWQTKPLYLSLFHYNPHEIERYSCKNIETVYRVARQ